MCEWVAEPLVGINDIKFGMSRDDVRKAFNGKFTEFKKSKFSKNTTDDFGVCHVFYSKDDKCEAVEVFNECHVTIHGKVVFPADIEFVKTVITNLKFDGNSYISKDMSIGIYAPDGQAESILFGAPGYYE